MSGKLVLIVAALCLISLVDAASWADKWMKLFDDNTRQPEQTRELLQELLSDEPPRYGSNAVKTVSDYLAYSEVNDKKCTESELDKYAKQMDVLHHYPVMVDYLAYYMDKLNDYCTANVWTGVRQAQSD